MNISRTCTDIAQSQGFHYLVAAVIVLSALILGLEQETWAQQYKQTFQHLDDAILLFFVIELLIRILAHGAKPWHFFNNLWNIFDFLIVMLCFLPDTRFAVALRLVRVLRILRLLSQVQQAEIYRLRNIELARAHAELKRAKDESERLLHNILPHSIAQRLKGGEQIIADSYEDVSVLFADIVSFTELSSRVSPQQLVRLLDEIFSGFDCLAERHQLEKIKTIGDAYMLVAGVPQPKPEHLQAVVNMALDIPTLLRDFNQRHNSDLQVRIGIHVGPVVAGVIGQKKFIYDLWGDTVNIASRMESHGAPGKIHVTDAVYQRLKGYYRFEPRGRIDIKGKAKMLTYFLLGPC